MQSEKRELTCIGCPIGCLLTAEIIGENIQISGNSCKIGVEYGINECKDPRRIVTTSIRVVNGNDVKLLSVKTNHDIPKNRIFEVLEEIKKLRISGESKIQIGDAVIKNILGLGVDIVATSAV